MIGAGPCYKQAPLEYRYALDAAMTWLAHCRQVAVVCAIPALHAEVAQRTPVRTIQDQPDAGLWVEPLVNGWQADLAALAPRLPAGAPLAVVASQPLARLIPERRGWSGAPLGMRPGGLRTLREALGRAGFCVEQQHGVHSLDAIIRNQFGRLLARAGRPDLADRQEFAARLHYRAAPPWTTLATTCLWLARRAA